MRAAGYAEHCPDRSRACPARHASTTQHQHQPQPKVALDGEERQGVGGARCPSIFVSMSHLLHFSFCHYFLAISRPCMSNVSLPPVLQPGIPVFDSFILIDMIISSIIVLGIGARAIVRKYLSHRHDRRSRGPEYISGTGRVG